MDFVANVLTKRKRLEGKISNL